MGGIAIQIEVLGGCGEYGRNCFYLEENDQGILLDCGIMNDVSQGLPRLTKKQVKKLKIVFISHLHQDHVGALHLLEKWGYKGPIILSETTYQWLPDKQLLTFEPFQTSQKNGWQKCGEVEFLWGYSGHVVGSVWYCIRVFQKTIFYSGDVLFQSTLYPIDVPPELKYDLAFIDSGNANVVINNAQTKEEIREMVNQTPSCCFKIECKDTGKCLELLGHLYQTTSCIFSLDLLTYQWLCFNFENQVDLLTSGEHLLEKVLASQRIKVEEVITEGIYFIHEKSPNQRGDSHKWNTEINHLPYKNHLDNQDIIHWSNLLNAKQTIYFHSPDLTEQAQIQDVVRLVEGK